MKMVNPFPIVVPLSPGDHDAWREGFLLGFCSPINQSTNIPQPDDVADGNIDAFNMGVSAGQQAASLGWEAFNKPCVSASENSHAAFSEGETVGDGLRVLTFTAMDVAKHGIAVATIGAALIEVFLLIAFETKFTLRPQLSALPRLGQKVVDILNSIGASSIEIFLGVASDPVAEGCEILMTQLFRTLGQATSAAQATGRDQWAVVSFRTDMCSSFRVVAGGW